MYRLSEDIFIDLNYLLYVVFTDYPFVKAGNRNIDVTIKWQGEESLQVVINKEEAEQLKLKLKEIYGTV